MRDVYHHLTDPAVMNASVAMALKPGGRVAIVDFTPPGDEAACPADRAKDGMHGVTAATVTREMKDAGFEPVEPNASTQRWFLLVFSRTGKSGAATTSSRSWKLTRLRPEAIIRDWCA